MYRIISTREEREKEAKKVGVLYQENYEVVLAEIATTRLRKCEEYGESRYEEVDREWNMEGVLWDIHRKYIRIRKIFKTWMKNAAGLREALLDMANYCIMGVQLLDNYVGPPPESRRSPFYIEQVALAVPDPERFRRVMKMVLGLDDWHNDRVKAQGIVFGKETENEASLSFNYQLGPFELELIKYESGDNWHQNGLVAPGLSHMGLHLPPGMDMEDIIRKFSEMHGIKVAQEVVTKSHTNPAIADSRRYRYVVFDSKKKLGFDLKIIQRLDINGKPL